MALPCQSRAQSYIVLFPWLRSKPRGPYDIDLARAQGSAGWRRCCLSDTPARDTLQRRSRAKHVSPQARKDLEQSLVALEAQEQSLSRQDLADQRSASRESSCRRTSMAAPVNAATRLFHVPELLEKILLGLPRRPQKGIGILASDTSRELATMRLIVRGRLVCRTWRDL